MSRRNYGEENNVDASSMTYCSGYLGNVGSKTMGDRVTSCAGQEFRVNAGDGCPCTRWQLW
jgi:hypothetical protein